MREDFGFMDISYDDACQKAEDKFSAFSRDFCGISDLRRIASMRPDGSSFICAAGTSGELNKMIYDELLRNRRKFFCLPSKCSTMCTDGESLYINPYFVCWLSDSELMFVLAHEMNHIIANHLGPHGRLLKFEEGGKPGAAVSVRKKLAQAAADLVVNASLVKNKVGEIPRIKEGPQKGKVFGCYNEKFCGITTEEAVIRLAAAFCRKHDPECALSEPLPDNPLIYKDIIEARDAVDNCIGAVTRKDHERFRSFGLSLLILQLTGADGSEVIDDHCASVELYIKLAHKRGMTPHELCQDQNTAIKQHIHEIIQKVKASGARTELITVPGITAGDKRERWIPDQFPIRQPWECALKRLFSHIREGSRLTYRRYNGKGAAQDRYMRKYRDQRPVMPSYEGLMGKITVALDTSGSVWHDSAAITEAASAVLRLVAGAASLSPRNTIEILCCDTKISSEVILHGRGELLKYADELKRRGLPVTGAGGTDLFPIWERLLTEQSGMSGSTSRSADALIVCTDTQTMNAEKIAELYRSGAFKIPTLILSHQNAKLNQRFVEMGGSNYYDKTAVFIY